MTQPAPQSRGALLALAVSGRSASVAVGRLDGVACQLEGGSTDRREQSGELLAMISTVLDRAGYALADLAGVAFEAGPGAFTSLRVACAVAQGLGIARDIPLCPVGTLEAWAAASLRESGLPGRVPVAVATDARMGECYFGLFDLVLADGAGAADARPLHEVRCARPGELVEALGRWAREHPGLRFAGDAGAAWPEVQDALDRLSIAVPGALPDAGAILMLATGGEACWVDPAAAAPRYVREKVALDVDEQRALRVARQ